MSAASEPLARLAGQSASATLTPKPRLTSRTGTAEHPAAGGQEASQGGSPNAGTPVPTCSSRPIHGQRHGGFWACRSTTPPTASLPKPPHNGPCEHGPCTSKAHSPLLSSSLRCCYRPQERLGHRGSHMPLLGTDGALHRHRTSR